MITSPIIDFPGYFITTSGGVWSGKKCRGVKGRWLKSQANVKSGHLKVTLQNQGSEYQRLVHKLVAEAFIGPCPEGLQVRHLDGNPANNDVSNLAYGTPGENAADRTVHGTENFGSRNGQAILTESDVWDIRGLVEAGVPPKEVAAIFEVNRVTVSDIIAGRRWSWLK